MTPTHTCVWTDPDLSHLLVDDPELAAIADAVRESAPAAAYRQTRPLPVRLGALAAAVAAVAALVLLAPWGGKGPALTDRALAALGDDPVLHVVTTWPSDIDEIDLRTGASHRVLEREETWYDRRRGFVHTITRWPDGSLAEDALATPQVGWIAADPLAGGKPLTVPTVDPALGAFLDGYQQALASGEATQTGTGTIDGTQVIWLTFPYGHETESVALDASTYRPLLVRDASGTEVYRIDSIETVGLSAANFERPTPTEAVRRASSGLAIDRTLLDEDPATAAQTLPNALWLGSSFRQMPLAGIEREALRTRFTDPKLAPETGVGLALVYGSTTSKGVPDRTRPFVQLWESDHPQPAYDWDVIRGIVPPEGVFATLGAGPGVVEPTGLLVRNGIYVTVLASTPELGLDAARALAPIASGSK